MDPVNFGTTMAAAFRYFDDQDGKTKKRPKAASPTVARQPAATAQPMPAPIPGPQAGTTQVPLERALMRVAGGAGQPRPQGGGAPLWQTWNPVSPLTQSLGRQSHRAWVPPGFSSRYVRPYSYGPAGAQQQGVAGGFYPPAIQAMAGRGGAPQGPAGPSPQQMSALAMLFERQQTQEGRQAAVGEAERGRQFVGQQTAAGQQFTSAEAEKDRQARTALLDKQAQNQMAMLKAQQEGDTAKVMQLQKAQGDLAMQLKAVDERMQTTGLGVQKEIAAMGIEAAKLQRETSPEWKYAGLKFEEEKELGELKKLEPVDRQVEELLAADPDSWSSEGQLANFASGVSGIVRSILEAKVPDQTKATKLRQLGERLSTALTSGWTAETLETTIPFWKHLPVPSMQRGAAVRKKLLVQTLPIIDRAIANLGRGAAE
ncbi:MAG TPA: hypothetical protein VM238_18465 [Phycisphaerae bacterium]|nr:hypothetical protein [Phycisphaerae bacterium]